MTRAPSRVRRARIDQLRASWLARWPEALAIWSKFTRLREPIWCVNDGEAHKEGLSDSFAMIRFADQAVVLNLELILRLGVENFPLEVLAHEIGHHVYCPGDLTDQGRILARMRWSLPTKERQAPFIANLYADLLINDRLQRSAGLSMAGVFQQLVGSSSNRLWTLYMRIYEILWSVPRGQLATGPIDAHLEGDAQIGARLIRAYSREWLDGAGRFAALCLPYLIADDGEEIQRLLGTWQDTANAGAGSAPAGLTEIEAGEREGAIHPAADPALTGFNREPGQDGHTGDTVPKELPSARSAGQYREPFEYGELLKSLGLPSDDHEIAVRYYKERAVSHLIRFPEVTVPESTDPLPEGLEPWDIGSPVESAEWFESAMISPYIVPGMTTVQRVWGTIEGTTPERHPLDLDLYVDSSGSMPNPQRQVSYLTLAGAIIALSALRAGARVQATLWSGARQFTTTQGFVRDEHQILNILTGYFGGATAFPIHMLRDTYTDRRPGDRPVHILVISDDGVTTMFEKDELGASGLDLARMALEKARGGGTLVLNLWSDWETNQAIAGDLGRARDQGWQIERIETWEDLVAFARAFSAATYANG